MALFGNDYDTDYGYRSGRWGGYDRGYMGNGGYSGSNGYRAGWNGGERYDRGYLGYGAGGYDANYKSQWETDYGDPFGDRSSGTPIRAIRGPYHAYDRNYNPGYDRGYMNRGGWGAERQGYGNDYYSANPMGYEPYRRGTWNRYGQEYRGNFGRGYDSGWF